MTLIADHASIRDLIEELSREYLVDNLEAVGDVLEKLRNQAQLTADYIQQVTESFVNYTEQCSQEWSSQRHIEIARGFR